MTVADTIARSEVAVVLRIREAEFRRRRAHFLGIGATVTAARAGQYVEWLSRARRAEMVDPRPEGLA